MYDPELLRTFLAVSESLSFTRAGEHLDLRQPTVSQHVRRLDRRLAASCSSETPVPSDSPPTATHSPGSHEQSSPPTTRRRHTSTARACEAGFASA